MAEEALVILPRAKRHQLPVLLSPARFKVAVCGRRWGKTALGLLAVCQGHGPGFRFRGAVDGGQVWWVAPTFPISNLIWRDLKKALRYAWVDKSELERRIVLPGGGAVTVKSAENPDSLRGAGLDGVVMDEAASCPEDAWTESLRPALADRQGWAIFIGTPKAEQPWFRELFDHAAELDGWDRWQRPSSDAPWMTEQELAAARNEMGAMAFAQECDAQFLQPDEIAIWPSHWWGRYDELPDAMWRGCISVDTAGWDDEAVHTDYSVMAVWLTDSQNYYLADLVRGRLAFPDVERYCLQLRAEYQLPIVVEDVPWARPLIQRLQTQTEGVQPFKVAGHSKSARLMAVAPIGEAGRCFLPRAAGWLDDFVREHAQFPHGTNDDQVDTTTMALLYLGSRTQRASKPGRTWSPRWQEVRA